MTLFWILFVSWLLLCLVYGLWMSRKFGPLYRWARRKYITAKIWFKYRR